MAGGFPVTGVALLCGTADLLAVPEVRTKHASERSTPRSAAGPPETALGDLRPSPPLTANE